MGLASQIAAFALAAAQPGGAGAEAPAAQAATAPSPVAPAADPDELLRLFERLCVNRGAAPAGFDVVPWSDFPEPLRLMNPYDHAGTFLRGETPAPVYIARTEGDAHMGPGVETRCGVAARSADVERIVSRLAESAGTERTAPVEMGDISMWMLIGRGGAFTVYSTEGGWVILRNLGILIPAEMVRPRDVRRRGKRN